MSADDAAEGGGRQRRELPSSGTQLNVHLVMNQALEKLRLLDYETKYCRSKQIEPYPVNYFVMEDSNHSNQFTDFLSLVRWLMQECRVHDFTVDKYDSASESINNLMLALRQMEFSLDFPASKLRGGTGAEVCSILDFLAERALAANGFRFSEPQYPQEEFAQEAEVDDDTEVIGGDDEIPEDMLSDDDDEAMYSEQVRTERTDELEESMRGKMENGIDPVIWQTELERVGPRLKVRAAHSGKEWRTHIESTKKHGSVIEKILPDTRKQLARINDSIKSSVERLQSKERYMNSHFDSIIREYKEVQERLKSVQQRQASAGEAVGKYQNSLQGIVERLEDVKVQMDERNSGMTDTSPVVRIKKALQTLKRQIKEMELRMGVLSHTLMHAKMRQRLSRDRNIEARAAGKRDTDEPDMWA